MLCEGSPNAGKVLYREGTSASDVSQALQQLAAVGTLGHVALKARQQQHLETCGHGLARRHRRWPRSFSNHVEQLEDGKTASRRCNACVVPRRAAGEHLEQHAAVRPNVRLAPVSGPFDVLGRHPIGTACHAVAATAHLLAHILAAAFRAPLGALTTGQTAEGIGISELGGGAEVCNLRTHSLAGRLQQHVVSLEIAVDDHILVQEVQASQQVHAVCTQKLMGQSFKATRAQQRADGAAAAIFHENIMLLRLRQTHSKRSVRAGAKPPQ
mmetsp:Transcript_86911/g.173536  ORF Transcript_86911/g.173536 Transcript_86911/m.173536 type:complete len:269 (+) Transcript_86911:144-950(+)